MILVILVILGPKLGDLSRSAMNLRSKIEKTLDDGQ